MYTLQNPVRDNAWGSRTVIAELTGRPAPTSGPEAEMWLGAHRVASSELVTPTGSVSLLDAIAADPQTHLGPALQQEYQGRLPFLFKVLAAETPLSIQAHPSRAQARAGYAEEDARGVPLTSPERTYQDSFPKPELFVAQSECELLCGFRPAADSARILTGLELESLSPYVAALRADQPEDGIREVVTTVLSIPEARRRQLVAKVAAACAERSTAGRPDADAYVWAARLAQVNPGDVGVVLSLLLNLVRLQPDQGVFLGAGVPHAYLHGWGLEPQANSDNTLRGGLTPKHVDVPGLLRILDFRPHLPGMVEPVDAAVDDTAAAVGEQVWPTPAREFTLSRLVLGDGDAVLLPGGNPQVLLCLDGKVRLDSAAAGVVLARGESAYAPAAEPMMSASGPGTLVRVTPGRCTRYRSP